MNHVSGILDYKDLINDLMKLISERLRLIEGTNFCCCAI